MYNDNIVGIFQKCLDINFFLLNGQIIYFDVYFENMVSVIFWYDEEGGRDEEKGECFFRS